jgi:PPP family 3-phenylpropionic acid transporter
MTFVAILTGHAGRLALFYGAVFAVLGILAPFWPVWLAGRGLDAEEIGIVLAMVLAVRVFANPAIAHIADIMGERRRPIIFLAGASIVAFALYIVADGFWAILIVTALFSAARAGVLPLGESLVMMTTTEHRIDYGRVRLWGSLTFIGGAALTGELLIGRSTEVVYWLSLGALVIAFVACMALPDVRPPAAERSHMPLKALATQPLFVLFMISAALVQGGHAVYYAFSTLHWQAAGHSSFVIGLLWAEGVVAEIILFAISGRVVAAIGPAGLIALGGLAGALRWVVTAETTDLTSLVVVQALHAFTFGATHLGSMYFITRSVPPALTGTAQSLYAAVVGGIGMGLATLASGHLYDSYSGGAFHVMAVMCLVGAILALVLKRLWQGQEIVGAAP